MKVLVFCQHDGGKVLKASLSALTAAVQIGGSSSEVHGLTLGAGAQKAAQQLGSLGIAAHFNEDSSFDGERAVLIAQAIEAARAQAQAEIVVAAATSVGKDALPRVAAMLDAGQASDITAVNGDGSFVRPMYAGNVFATVELTTTHKVITVRPTAFAPFAATGASAGAVSSIALSVDDKIAGTVTGFEGAKSERPALGDAEVVVSGGRALASSENFQKVIFPLADALGAAVGASRAAVDSGYAPNDWQVGQTGKVVAPQLYVAVGISGAIQHLAGMKDSKCIVAINKDGDAPIYEVADYGLVADLFTAVPELVSEVKRAKSNS